MYCILKSTKNDMRYIAISVINIKQCSRKSKSEVYEGRIAYEVKLTYTNPKKYNEDQIYNNIENIEIR